MNRSRPTLLYSLFVYQVLVHIYFIYTVDVGVSVTRQECEDKQHEKMNNYYNNTHIHIFKHLLQQFFSWYVNYLMLYKYTIKMLEYVK